MVPGLNETRKPLCTPDGVAADGNGNIFVANFLNSIVEYNIAGNTVATVASASGIDDLASVAGIGAPSVPEPTSILLAVVGIASAYV